mmetsp:Transcript_16461/g.11831  ORF Transcript_16461/g.11831 Transcript_16461/m.11831 type:complete len:143 (+) Transcript_16461:194-622(+)|eukprot:CAMPEP_0202963570 /NCGR_PEP_ID=MMETSP1396-20130829/7575_1 /ASSEMBLY_ACC=CAM_ASM_000872 /TAXON_ID= /ORGANISM="Pseudokeronopsis sp., Strain Brazil" /LENGTH=142 /DNA_ID=CAMNT_0049684909 /DNA_START=148 /DNA_END=576 /DNA_ORIENTATION=+
MNYELNQQSKAVSVFPLLKHLISLTKQLMLNELEISYWNLMNRLVGAGGVSPGELMQDLMMTGLFSKQVAAGEKESKIYEDFFTHNYPKVMGSYQSWLDQHKQNLTIFSEDSGKQEEVLRLVKTSFDFLFCDQHPGLTFPSD